MGLVLISPERITIEKSLKLDFSATNNEAKYEALLKGMSMVQKLGGKAVNMFSDSRLIVGQVNGELEARDKECKNTWTKLSAYNLTSILLAYRTSLEVEIPMLTPWPCLLPPRIKVYPGHHCGRFIQTLSDKERSDLYPPRPSET